MKQLLGLLSLVLITASVNAQQGIGAPEPLGDTYKIKLYRDDCKTGRCKEGGSGTLTFKSYSSLKEYTGSFGDENAFVNGLLIFNNGDTYEGSFKTSRANKYASLSVDYDSGTYTKKNEYRYTARFVDGRPEGETVIAFNNGAEFRCGLKKGLLNGTCVLRYADSSMYKGEYRDGYAHGKGIIQYSNGLVYDGEWKEGKREGFGVFTKKNERGYYFAGAFIKDYPNGLGKLALTGSPDTLTGTFANGHRNGFFEKKSPGGKLSYQYYKFDTLVYADLVKLPDDRYCMNGSCTAGKGRILEAGGVIYEGDVKNGKEEGTGMKTLANGAVYRGQFSNNNMHGKGRMVWPDASWYEGGWVNGLRAGTGTYHWADNSHYEGEFVNNDRSGKGRFTDASGNNYNGDWLNNKYNGKGTYTWINSNGKPDVYEGEWKDGNRTGKGVFTASSGLRYEGDFADGGYKGTGKLVTSDGDIYESTSWSGNNFTSGTYTKKGASPVPGIMKDNRFLDADAQAALRTPGANGVIPVEKRLADMHAGLTTGGPNITHAERTVNLAFGSYSIVVANWPMLASFATGFKQYYIVAGAGGKKYPVPFGIRITFEFINSKGELVDRKSVSGYNLEGVLNPPTDGDYTIQARYDFEGCINCEQPEGIRLTFTLLSRDYIYK
jgi:hypothetical protein